MNRKEEINEAANELTEFPFSFQLGAEWADNNPNIESIKKCPEIVLIRKNIEDLKSPLLMSSFTKDVREFLLSKIDAMLGLLK